MHREWVDAHVDIWPCIDNQSITLIVVLFIVLSIGG